MASINSGQVMGCLVSSRILTAASRALSFFGAASRAFLGFVALVAGTFFLGLFVADMFLPPLAGKELGNATAAVPSRTGQLPRCVVNLKAIPLGFSRIFFRWQTVPKQRCPAAALLCPVPFQCN